MNTQLLSQSQEAKDFFEIKPDYLSFGCVCQGFIYELNMSIANKSLRPMHIRVSCISYKGEKNRLKSNFEPKKVAPGMSINVVLEYHADYPTTSNFEIRIARGINEETISTNVSAYVVPMDIFKNIAKSLQLQKKRLYRNGVKPVGTTNTILLDEKSIISRSTSSPTQGLAATASILSEALMDEDDIEEFLDLPIFRNTYWDPRIKQMFIDEKIGNIEVDGTLTVEQSIKRNEELWEQRCEELESNGYYTLRTKRKMNESKTLFDTTSIIDDENAEYEENEGLTTTFPAI